METNILVIILIVIILLGAILYIIKAKKQGQKCIGCPHSKTCSKKTCNTDNKK